MLKKRASGGDITKPLSASEYLICSAQASSQFLSQISQSWTLTCLSVGAVTAAMTNPLWLVRVRMFTTRADSTTSYKGLWGMYTL